MLEELFQQLFCQIFSNRCQLTSLKIDITKSYHDIHQCLKSDSYFHFNTINDGFQSYCITLRHLKIYLDYPCFLEDLIEHVPNLEQLSVHLKQLQRDSEYFHPYIPSSIVSNPNWYNKVPKLESFTLKCSIVDDIEFSYLKSILNNVNHVRKLEIHLYGINTWGPDRSIWKSTIDANFIRQYCLPDQIINLKYFYFYIYAKCEFLLSNDINKIINSFKINSFFIDHQWTDVECVYDKNRLFQHIYSSNMKKIPNSIVLLNYPHVHGWPDIENIQIFFHLSLYLFLEQFDKLCPNFSCITITRGPFDITPTMVTSLATLFERERQSLKRFQLRNVTKLRFGSNYSRTIKPYFGLTDADKIAAKIFASIISMPVQLKYIFIDRLQWFIHITQYAFEDLRENALNTVLHAEFGIASCNIGGNESAQIGKHLVPLLSTFMPNLQTLFLWRPDDFPWTSIRPNLRQKSYSVLVQRWQRSLRTPESIAQHVTIFEQDLRQLFEQLKQLVYLNIYGETLYQKVELYRLMVQNRFPNSRVDIQVSRFRLWI